MGETSQRGSCSSLSANRGTENFMDRRPPIPPHRSTTTSSIPNQTALFVWKGQINTSWEIGGFFLFIL